MKIFKLRRGPIAHMPSLNQAELVYASDTNELYIGTNSGINTTPHFDGGTLSNITKGRLIPRHGTVSEIRELKEGELFYLEDVNSLAIALQNNNYIVLDEGIRQAIALLAQEKRSKYDLIMSDDIAMQGIKLQHLSPDVQLLLTGTENPVELVLASDSITQDMLTTALIDFIEEDRQIYDFGNF